MACDGHYRVQELHVLTRHMTAATRGEVAMAFDRVSEMTTSRSSVFETRVVIEQRMNTAGLWAARWRTTTRTGASKKFMSRSMGEPRPCRSTFLMSATHLRVCGE